MKAIHTILTLFIFFSASCMFSQEAIKSNNDDKKEYYHKRAKEDAAFEQKYKPKSNAEERKFWKEQKQYEKDLKAKDKIAYEAYMQGKKDAYSEHYENCADHCHHSRYYHSRINFYYHQSYYYNRSPSRRSSEIRVNVRSPRISLGVF